MARMPTNNFLKMYLNSPDYFENLIINICEKIAFGNWVEVITSLIY